MLNAVNRRSYTGTSDHHCVVAGYDRLGDAPDFPAAPAAMAVTDFDSQHRRPRA